MFEWKYRPKADGEIEKYFSGPLDNAFSGSQHDMESFIETLTREAIQNPLDAGVNKAEPIKVIFGLGHFYPKGNNIELFSEMEKHLTEETKLEGYRKDLSSNNQCRYLTIEDTGTTGLKGSRDSNHGLTCSPFQAFCFNIGKSEKKDGDNGSAGLGKTMLIFASKISSIFFTSSPIDSDDEFLWGFSQLEPRTVDDVRYVWGDGKFGNLLTPLSNKDESERRYIESFRKIFRLTRSSTEHGVSIVIPFPRNEITFESIRKHIISQFFHAIYMRSVIFEIVDHDQKQDREVINKESLDIEARKDPWLSKMISLHKEITNPEANNRYSFSMGKEYKTALENLKQADTAMLESLFSDEEILKMQNSYENGEIMVVQPKFFMKLKDQETGSSRPPTLVSFQMALQKFDSENDDDLKKRHIMIRNQLRLDPAFPVRNAWVYVYIDDLLLMELFRRGEDPGHRNIKRQLSKDAKDDVESYCDDGNDIFGGVMRAASRMINTLNRPREKILENTFIHELFVIPSEQFTKGTNSPSRRNKQVSPAKGGFPLKGSSYFIARLDSPYAFQVRLADLENAPEIGDRFKTEIGNAKSNSRGGDDISDHNELDFNLTDDTIHPITDSQDIKLSDRSRNTVVFEITGKNPQFRVHGFDGDCDLVVRTEATGRN